MPARRSPSATATAGLPSTLRRDCAAEAGPGETLASEAVIHLAAKMEGIAYVDARGLKLKGYADPVRVVVVVPSERAKGHRLASGDGSRVIDRARYAIVGVAVVGVALVAGVLGGGLLGRGGPATASPSSAPSASPDPLRKRSPPCPGVLRRRRPATLAGTTHLGSPRNIAFFSNGSFWILGENPRAFNRVDPASRTIAQSIPIALVEASGFNFDDDSIWVTDLGSSAGRSGSTSGPVSSCGTSPSARTRRIQAAAHDVAVGAGSVWLSPARRPGDHPSRRQDRQGPGTPRRPSLRGDLRRRGALVLAGRMAGPDRPGHQRADLRRDPALARTRGSETSTSGAATPGRPRRARAASGGSTDPDARRASHCSPVSVRWPRPSTRCG